MAQDFCDDVRLIWSNCILYNPPGNLVRVAAEKAQKRFETEWANSGLSSERTKRATAGVSRPKYEPDYEAPLPKADTYRGGAAPTKSGNANTSGKKQAPAAPASAPGRVRLCFEYCCVIRRSLLALVLLWANFGAGIPSAVRLEADYMAPPGRRHRTEGVRTATRSRPAARGARRPCRSTGETKSPPSCKTR